MSDIELNQLLLVKLQEAEHEDANPTPAANAVLASLVLPDYSYKEIQRIVAENGISAAKVLIGQEFLTFEVNLELRGSGQVGVAPDWGVLAEIAGYTKRIVAAATIGSPEKAFGNSGGPSGLTVASAGAFTGTRPVRYLVTVTTAGASGAAKCSIVCLDDATQNSTNNVITTAEPINLGDEGATIAFTFASGELALGDAWYVHCYTPCVAYVSRAPTDPKLAATIYNYLGQHLFKAVDVRGDFNLNFPAGALATGRFSVRGLFGGVSDAATPAGDYFNQTMPPTVESAGVLFGSYSGAVVPELSFTSGNQLTERPDMNSPKGIKGFRYGKRDPRWSATVEAELEATHPFWADLRNRTEWPLNAKAGSVDGNIVQVWVRRASTAGNALQDKENILHYGLSGQAHAVPGKYDNIEIIVR